jgi:uncharacterized protein YdeI (YjbR/CyaY-like superfamily)
VAKLWVAIGDHSYRTPVARMDGRFRVPLSAENRSAAGVAAGDAVEVDISLDAAPREVGVPADLVAAFAQADVARQRFDDLAVSHRKEWVRYIEEAKTNETRARRIDRTVAELREGQRAH